MCGTAGYFFNEANAGLAMARIDRFEAFSKQNNLSFSGSPYVLFTIFSVFRYELYAHRRVKSDWLSAFW